MSTPTLDHARLEQYAVPLKKPWPMWALLLVEVVTFVVMWMANALLVVTLVSAAYRGLTRTFEVNGVLLHILIGYILLSVAFGMWMATNIAKDVRTDHYARVPQGLVIDQLIKGNKHFIVIEGYTRLNKVTSYLHRVSAGDWLKDKSIEKGQYVDFRNATDTELSRQYREAHQSVEATS